MFFYKDDMQIKIIGVFSIEREKYTHTAYARDYLSLSLRTSGEGTMTFNGETHDLKRGDLLYLPPNLKYTQTSSQERIIAIHLLVDDPSPIPQILSLSQHSILKIEDNFSLLHQVWTAKKEGYDLHCLSILYKILYLISKEENNPLSTINKRLQDPIKEAVNYIHQHCLDSSIKISTLCNISHLSEDYFRKTFKKLYDVSPHQYILNLKLENAEKMLKSELYSISEVSEMCGFSDYKYFSRVFKKHYGVSPSAYVN